MVKRGGLVFGESTAMPNSFSYLGKNGSCSISVFFCESVKNYGLTSTSLNVCQGDVNFSIVNDSSEFSSEALEALP